MSLYLYYNGHTITLDRSVTQWQVDVAPEGTMNTTMTGRVETILTPRVNIHVTGACPLRESATLRTQLHNWWQWGQRGGVWALAFDSSRRVDTTLDAAAALGDTTITVVDATGIIEGEIYKLFHGPNYQLVRVTNVSSNTLTLAETIDATYGAVATKCVVRDQHYYFGQIRDSQAPLPILDVTAQQLQPLPQSRFVLNFDFYETFSGDLSGPS